jgi:hypothetical protein
MNSGPMKNILEFLSTSKDEFEILKFNENMIFTKPIEVRTRHQLINILGMVQM